MTSMPAGFAVDESKLVLTVEESTLITQFVAASKLLPKDSNDLNEALRILLKGEGYSFAAKHKIATLYPNNKDCVRWGYEFMEGKNLWWMTTLQSLTAEYLPAALRNPNWNWDIAKSIFYNNKIVAPSTKNKFFTGLPSEVKTFEFMSALLAELDATNLDQSLVLVEAKQMFEEARRRFDLDESIPDSWIVRIFKGV